ncbi:MAG: hypothetical protein ACRC2R_25050 [Xenococcaceae cyanobacterium]
MSDAVSDTHALIWYLEDSPRLSAAANKLFEQCDLSLPLISRDSKISVSNVNTIW